MYYEGYKEAKENVGKANLNELLEIIDTLYGKDNLKFGDTVEDVRKECLLQVKRDFTNTDSKEYKDIKFWTEISKVK